MATQRDETSVLSGGNAAFIAELYARFVEDPGSVDQSWREFFSMLSDDARAVLNELKGASGARQRTRVIGVEEPQAAKKPANGKANGTIDVATARGAILDSLRALSLIRNYRTRGHLQANLDPLGLEPPKPHPELEIGHYGFTEADLGRPIFIDTVLGQETLTLGEIIDRMRTTYCDTVGVEYMHIQDPEQRAWLQERVEAGRNHTDFTVMGKRAIY